ncbi:MAG: peptidase M14 [Planctomycetes bacterium]|nr:peptidase M14 [Planctomycetota bacterium]
MARMLGVLLLLLPVQEELRIDAELPGGNIIVDKVDGDSVSLHQDLRDTKGDWFYWAFRVRGAQGRTLTFRFTKGDVVGVLGPAMSLDGGETWSWLGKESVKGPSFQAAFPADARDVRFCVSIPYFEKDLRKFLARHEKEAGLRVETLCETKKGRKVERLRLGSGPNRILLTARHHACEMIASYVLEGILEEALSDAWYREKAEIMAIPFVDKDGVEDGDQGKNRIPRDHNRDYSGESLYASTKALREFAPKWSEGGLRFALDLHCPTLRGAHNETIYFVGSENPDNWKKIEKLAGILESIQSGPLLYRAADNVPFGTAWNTATNFTQGMSFARWAQELPGNPAATTIEVSYAHANGRIVSADSARALGRDLARSLRKFLE